MSSPASATPIVETIWKPVQVSLPAPLAQTPINLPIPRKDKGLSSQLLATSSKEEIKETFSGRKTGSQVFSKAFAMSRDEGKLSIDLRNNLFSHLSHQNSEEEDELDSHSDSLSEEDDNPDAESDRFLKVVSKRVRRQNLRRARAGGPSNL